MLVIGDSEDDQKAAAELGCHFAGVIQDDDRRFNQIPARHVSNQEDLKGVAEHLRIVLAQI